MLQSKFPTNHACCLEFRGFSPSGGLCWREAEEDGAKEKTESALHEKSMVVSTNSRETCVYSRQSLGEQPGLLRGRTGVKQERPSPGQQGSYVNEDHCSSKRVQKQPLPLRFCDSCNNRTTSMSQKIRGKFSVFQETPKVSEIPREGEEPPNDTLNLLVAR